MPSSCTAAAHLSGLISLISPGYPTEHRSIGSRDSTHTSFWHGKTNAALNCWVGGLSKLELLEDLEEDEDAESI
jgi:hypothetical protein